jgi:PKD repeat protein
MKKFLLVLHLAGFGLLATAQHTVPTFYKDNKLQMLKNAESVVFNTNPTPAQNPAANFGGSPNGARAAVLNAQRIGSAGNGLTAINAQSNQIFSIDSLNTVTFIHRNDPSLHPGTTVSNYRYDRSNNRGQTWAVELGPINNDASIDNVLINGRFPQALIYNPAGNTNVDSAWFVYTGTWHSGDAGSWEGDMRGRGKYSGDTSTFNVSIDQVNGGEVAINSGFCQSVPGTFWSVNQASNQTFTAGADNIITGAVLQKGVFNDANGQITWTETVLNATFEQTQGASGEAVSTATSFNIAFDPTGQYGWVSCLGDITSGDSMVYQPIFWKSTDGGQSWTGPEQVELADIQGVMGELSQFLVDGTTPTIMYPTTAFDADLAVDADGNPHLITVIGNGFEYSIQTAGYDAWDITYDANAGAGCQWKGLHLGEIETLRGTIAQTGTGTEVTDDNRPLISRSEDGTKIFFFWNDSDIEITINPENTAPNFFGRAIDLTAGTITALKNFSEGDTLFGGQTVAQPGGALVGAKWPIVSQYAWANGSVWNVPTVFTQPDYNNGDPVNTLPDYEEPTAFWYISNINFANSEFSLPIDQTAPTITLNGNDTVTILVNTAYTEDGATAFDCTDGNITPTVTSTVDTSTVGYYTVTYTATDAAGNVATLVRTVIVGAQPVAAFTWTNPAFPYKFNFQDQTANLPTQWQWNFGDNTGSIAQNPIKTYFVNGNYNVCLTATNSFGSNTVCQQVTADNVGINDVAFSNKITLFPNPTSGVVNMVIEGNVTSDLTVTVYNVLGEVAAAPSFYKAGTTNIQLNLSGVSNGLYLVKVQGNEGTAVKTLTINGSK